MTEDREQNVGEEKERASDEDVEGHQQIDRATDRASDETEEADVEGHGFTPTTTT